MKQEFLDQDIYDSYCLRAYLDSVLCSNNIIAKLENDYKNNIVNEYKLLTFILNYVYENPELCNMTSKISHNIYTIISNVDKKNIDIVNEIKRLLNSNKTDMKYEDAFLVFQYVTRRYGVGEFNKLTLFQQYELRKCSMPFFLALEDKLCDSIEFDYKLIDSIVDDKQPYDECLNNPNFLLSLNYFRFAYPNIFKDTYILRFCDIILEYQSLNDLNINNQYKMFGDFNEHNAKLLKFVKKEIKKYG